MNKTLIFLLVSFLFANIVIATDIPGIQTPIPINPTGSGSCPTGYYTYQQPLNANSPLLDDVFAGKAHFQSPAEAQKLIFIPKDYFLEAGQKMPVTYNPADGKYYAFTRQHDSDHSATEGNIFYSISIWSSPDGITFTEVGKMFTPQTVYNHIKRDAALWNVPASSLLGIYDGHLSIDYSFCPARYIMAMECDGYFCASYSETPFQPGSWPDPVPIVDYDRTNQKSASTGVFLVDGNQKYASWTVVDDKQHYTYSQGISTQNLLSNLGLSTVGNVLLPAEKNTHCTTSWDCNNRDKQDWKKEGNYYYLIYNGANYYRCTRPSGDTGTSDWGIGIVRSTSPLSGYNLSGIGKFIDSENKTTCAAQYPVINNINGELYMYFDYMSQNGKDMTLRSKLVWNSAQIIPEDLNSDGKVDISDLSILKNDFGKTSNFNTNADLNKDNIINLKDIVLMAKNIEK